MFSMRLPLFASLLLLSSTALADQAYIQANAWSVNRLPVMPGQEPHTRCLLQTSFSGTSSVQFIADGQRLRGAIFILTEPVFKEEGRSIDVSLTLDGKAWAFPAFTLSKYAVAVELSDAYEQDFRAALAEAKLLILKSGFDSYNFSLQDASVQLKDALACTPPAPPKPLVPVEAPAPVVAAPVEKPAEFLTPLPEEELAPVKAEALPAVTPPVSASAPTPLVATTEVSKTTTTIVNKGGEKPEPVSANAHFVGQAGKDVALGNALPMILPQGYDFKFTQGASPGERITWPAGGDWLETLIVALDDADLQVVAAGKTVTILPKIKPTQLAVVSTANPRASVIVKEPNALPAKKASDPTKPPSPGMLEEADLFLNNLKLDEAALQAISAGDAVPMPGKPDNAQTTVTETTTIVTTKSDDKSFPPEKGEDKLIVADVKGAEETEAPKVFSATKGETVQDVLSRWGAQESADLDVNLERDYFLSKDVTVQGDLDLAVERVLSQFDDLPSKPRLADGEAATDDGAPKVAAAPVAPSPPPEPSVQEKRLSLVSNWNAVQGTSLRSALTNWARQAQMQLVWQSPQDTIVAKNINGTRKLEDALDQLLGQYDDAPEKPNIQINRDPDTGQMAMLVDIQPFTMTGKEQPDTGK